MPAERVGNSAFAQSLHAIGYYCSSWLTAGFFPNYKHHRQSWAQGEAWSWVTRTLSRPFRLRRAKQREQTLIESGCPFFLLLLQINCDKQILVHSPIKSMRSLLESVVPSFAAHAPPDCKLVVKVHPLDSGMWPHEADLMELATAHGIADRVVFLDGSDLVLLLERCRGAITINSTAGVSALHMEVPLFAFGEAIYNSANLTHKGPIDSFWGTPQRPNRSHYWAFRRVVAHRSQINGGFYTQSGIEIALPAVVRALGGMLTEQEQGEGVHPAIRSPEAAVPGETLLHNG
jgi:capsular polysaccharide export protein